MFFRASLNMYRVVPKICYGISVKFKFFLFLVMSYISMKIMIKNASLIQYFIVGVANFGLSLNL